MSIPFKSFLRLCPFFWLIAFGTAGTAGTVTVFAAASLRTALDEVAYGFETATGHDATLSYAGSSALARQIQLGAPAQVFLSANPGWMDVLAADGLIHPGTRRDLLGNRLVLIGHEPQPAVPLSAAFDLAGLLGNGRLAMALVQAVPAGIYGKAALMRLGLWDSVSARVAQTDNVRAALALVALGEAPLGIVYATDAVADPRVFVLGTFPPDTHPPIRYPVAAIGDTASPETAAFLSYLSSPAAQEIFVRQGFIVLD